MSSLSLFNRCKPDHHNKKLIIFSTLPTCCSLRLSYALYNRLPLAKPNDHREVARLRDTNQARRPEQVTHCRFVDCDPRHGNRSRRCQRRCRDGTWRNELALRKERSKLRRKVSARWICFQPPCAAFKNTTTLNSQRFLASFHMRILISTYGSVSFWFVVTSRDRTRGPTLKPTRTILTAESFFRQAAVGLFVLVTNETKRH